MDKVLFTFEHCYIDKNLFNGDEEYFKEFEKVCKELNEKQKINFLFTTNGIKLNQYVGLIQIKDKYLEILPKIYADENCQSDPNKIKEGREILTKMLLIYLDIDPKDVKIANLDYDKYYLWDIYILIFANLVDDIIKKGLKKKYVRVRKNSKYLKGRLIVPQQIRKNLFNKERFYVEYEELSLDIPENRILKTTLYILQRKAISNEVKKHIKNLLFILDEIPLSTNIYSDLKKIYVDRTFDYYSYPLKLAKLFLSNLAFKPLSPNLKDTEEINSLLFDMNKLFEKFVAYQLKDKYNLPVETQEQKYYLIRQDKFILKPDIVIRRNNKIYILDTKWKKISQDVKDISQADLYQMLSYATVYLSLIHI